jgi:MFS family permease
MNAIAETGVQFQATTSSREKETMISEARQAVEETWTRSSSMHDLSPSEKEHYPTPSSQAPFDAQRPLDSERPPSGSDEERILSAGFEDDFPEGGLRAWLVVASAFFMLLPSYGFMVAIGTLQDYWIQNQLKQHTASEVGWVAGMLAFLTLALGIWVGPLFDRYGPRWLALVGSVGYVAMMFLLAECDKLWQMILCCGVLGGASAALLTTTALASVAHWFKVRRGLAQGVALAGSSCGGLSLPLILRSTLPKFGYTWSLRILGLVFLGCLTISNILIKARIPPSPAAKKNAIISLSIFRDLGFSLFTVFVFGFELVLFGGIGILPTYATLSGHFPPDTGFYLVSVLNGVAFVGRILPGYLADKIGRFNTILIMTVFTLFFMSVLWLPFGHRSLPVLYSFAALFGFGSGSVFALSPACIGQMCRAQDFGRYFGTMYSVASFATLVGIPMSGMLAQQVGLQVMVAFYCALLTVSLTSLVLSRWACLGRRWTVKVVI